MSKKSKKLIREQAAAARDAVPQPTGGPVDAAASDDPFAEFAGREWSFHFLPEAEPEPVDEKALHDLMKDWRHGRASRTIGQVLGDAYFTLFSLAVLGAMVVNLLLNSQHSAASCTTSGCLTSRTLLPWAVLFCVATLTLSVARMMGPVLASAAEGFWLMEAPISRTRLLTGRLWGALVLAFGVATAIGVLLALLSGADAVTIVGWGLATGFMASAMTAYAAAEQTHERTTGVRVLQLLMALAAAAVVVWMVAISSGAAPVVQTSIVQGPWIVAGAGAVLTIVFTGAALRRLEEIRRSRLVAGGSLVSGMQGAMFALDLGLARDILVEREAAARGYVRPTPGRGVGAQALVWRDVQRLVRFPRPLLGLGASALVPYAADALGLNFVMPLLAALALVAALVPFFGSLRVLSRNGGLARSFPFSTRELRNAVMVVPTALTVIWITVVSPAVIGLTGGTARSFADGSMTSIAIGMAGLLGAVRWQTAKATDFNSPMMATNAGAVPPNLIFNLFRGIDVVVLITAPIMLGAPIMVSLGIALVVYLLLGLNMADLQADAEDQKRRAAEAKANRPTQKIKITRPQR